MWRKYIKVGHGTLFRSPSGTWKLVLSVNGRDKCRSLGTKDRDESERKRQEIVEEARRGIIEEMARMPLLDAWTPYASSEEARRIGEDGMRRRFNAWKGFAAWMHTSHPEVASPRDVVRGMANTYIESLKNGSAAETVNKALFMLRGIFDILAGRSERNPFGHIAEMAFDSHPRRELTRDEIGRLLCAAEAMGREYRVLVLLAAYTGLRLGECCSLKWADIDARRGVLQFQPGKTRRYMNGRLVTIPIHWRLMKALLETPADERDGAVLPMLHARYADGPNRVGADLVRMFSDAGIETSVKVPWRKRRVPEASFHSLRHSFVSFAANAGVPLESLRAIVGHTTTAMTRHYYHADEDGLRMAVASVPEFDAWGDVVQRGDAPLFQTRADGDAAKAQRLREVEALFEEGFISERECNDACMRIACEA